MIPLLLLQVATPAPPAPLPPVPWEIRTRAAANGVQSTIAQVIGRDGSSRLLVKCDRGTEGLVSVQFFARPTLQTTNGDGAFASKPVALRFDNGAANEYEWEFRANAAFTSDDAAVTSLTQQLARAKQIKVETTSSANFRFEAVFDGPASDAPIRQVLGACGYVMGVGPGPLVAPTPVPTPAKPAPPPRKGRRK